MQNTTIIILLIVGPVIISLYYGVLSQRDVNYLLLSVYQQYGLHLSKQNLSCIYEYITGHGERVLCTFGLRTACMVVKLFEPSYLIMRKYVRLLSCKCCCLFVSVVNFSVLFSKYEASCDVECIQYKHFRNYTSNSIHFTVGMLHYVAIPTSISINLLK